MLVLQRLEGERLILTVPPSTTERQIVVDVVEIRSADRVRLGVTADRSIAVDREEIAKAKAATPRKTFEAALKRG